MTVFEERGVKLYLGDCRDMRDLLEADALVTEPPYGIAYQHSGGGNGKSPNRNLEPILGDDVAFDPSPWLHYNTSVMFGADHYSQRLPHGSWFIWDKLDGLDSFDSFADVEIAWCNRRGANRMFRNLWKGILRVTSDEHRSLHVSQKPVALMAWCMEKAKVPAGALVCDPYSGSATTAIACIRTGRRFVGCELDEAHWTTAVERIRRELAQGDLFLPREHPQAQPEAMLL